MKANQKFVNEDEGVSPVIAVILMVAITVVLAATVYLWVSGFGNQSGSIVQASFAAQAVDLPGGVGGCASGAGPSGCPSAAGTDSDSQDDAIKITYSSGQADLSSSEIYIVMDGIKLCPTTASSTNGFVDSLATAAAAGATCGTGVPSGTAAYCTNLPTGAAAGTGFTWARGAGVFLWKAGTAGNCGSAQANPPGLKGTHAIQVVAKSQVILDTTIEVHQ